MNNEIYNNYLLEIFKESSIKNYEDNKNKENQYDKSFEIFQNLASSFNNNLAHNYIKCLEKNHPSIIYKLQKYPSFFWMTKEADDHIIKGFDYYIKENSLYKSQKNILNTRNKYHNDVENYFSKCEYEYHIYIKEIFNISNELIKLSSPNSNREYCYEYVTELAFIALSIFPEESKNIEDFFIKMLNKYSNEYISSKSKENLLTNFSKEFNNKSIILERNEKLKHQSQLMRF
jgi:hypothetical protein